MRTLYRLKLVSSPNLSQLGKNEKASLEERGSGPNATWNRLVRVVCVAHVNKCHKLRCNLTSVWFNVAFTTQLLLYSKRKDWRTTNSIHLMKAWGEEKQHAMLCFLFIFITECRVGVWIINFTIMDTASSVWNVNVGSCGGFTLSAQNSCERTQSLSPLLCNN